MFHFLFKYRFFICGKALLLFWSVSVTFAQLPIRVDTADKLEDAVNNANIGIYNPITIQTGNGVLEVDSDKLNVDLGNGNSGYTIQAKNGESVLLKGDNGSGGIGLSIDGTNDPSQNSVLTLRDINLSDYYYGMNLKNSRLQLEGGNLKFSDMSRLVRFQDSNTLNASQINFTNRGNVLFENIYSAFEGDWMGTPGEVSLLFNNQGDVIANDTGLVTFGDVENFLIDFNNTGNVVSSGTNYFLDITAYGGSGLIQFRNAGDVNISNAIDYHGSSGGIGENKILFLNQGDVNFTRNGRFYLVMLDLLHFGNQGNVTFQDRGVYFWDGKTSPGDVASLVFDNQGDAAFVNVKNSFAGAVGFEPEGNAILAKFQNQGDLFFVNNFSQGSRVFSDIGGGAITISPKFIYGANLIFNSTGSTYFANNMAGRLLSSGTPAAVGGAIYFKGRGSERNVVFSPTGNNRVEFMNNWHLVGIDANNEYDYSIARSNAMYVTGVADIHLNPSKNASILFRDPIMNRNNGTRGIINVLQNGSGTTRFWNGWDYAKNDIAEAILGGTISIEQGRMLAMDHAVYATDTNYRLDVAVKNGGELGVSIDPAGNHSRIISETFEAEQGAKLFVTGISTFEPGSYSRVYEEMVVTNDPIASVPETMQVNNQFMHAEFRQSSQKQVDLYLYRVTNAASVIGGDAGFIDDMRLNPYLPEPIRWAIDDLYNYGEFTREMEDMLQSVSGTDYVNSLNAMRTNGRIFHQAMLGHMSQLDEQAGEHCFRRSCCDYLMRTPYQGRSSQLWGEFVQNWTEQKNPGHLRGDYSYDPHSLMFGKDSRRGQWNLGWAFQYAQGVTRSQNVLSPVKTETDTVAAGLYLGRTFGKNYLKMTAQAGLGYNETRTDYYQTNFGADGHFLSGILGTGMEFGRAMCLGQARHPWSLTPHIGVEYFWISGETFMENGGRSTPNIYGISDGYDFARRFAHASYHVIDIPIGFRISKTFQKDGWISSMTPTVDLAYVRSVGDSAPDVRGNFLASPDYSWRVNGTKMGRDAFRMNVGLTAGFLKNWSLNCQYGLEARHNHASQQVNASLTKQW